jgi:hypothetical protein
VRDRRFEHDAAVRLGTDTLLRGLASLGVVVDPFAPPPIRRPLAIAALLAIPRLIVAIAPTARHAKRHTALKQRISGASGAVPGESFFRET